MASPVDAFSKKERPEVGSMRVGRSIRLVTAVAGCHAFRQGLFATSPQGVFMPAAQLRPALQQTGAERAGSTVVTNFVGPVTALELPPMLSLLVQI